MGAVRRTAVLLQQLWSASAVKHAPAAAGSALHGSAVHGAGVHGTANSGSAAPGPLYTGQEQPFAEFCADTAGPRGARAYEAATRLAAARSGGFGLDPAGTVCQQDAPPFPAP